MIIGSDVIFGRRQVRVRMSRILKKRPKISLEQIKRLRTNKFFITIENVIRLQTCFFLILGQLILFWCIVILYEKKMTQWTVKIELYATSHYYNIAIGKSRESAFYACKTEKVIQRNSFLLKWGNNEYFSLNKNFFFFNLL